MCQEITLSQLLQFLSKVQMVKYPSSGQSYLAESIFQVQYKGTKTVFTSKLLGDLSIRIVCNVLLAMAIWALTLFSVQHSFIRLRYCLLDALGCSSGAGLCHC